MARINEKEALDIARWADGEMEDTEARAFEQSMAEGERAWAEFIRSHGELARDVFAREAEAVDFDGLTERVMLSLEDAPARDAELEMLAMAQADGEPLTSEDRARVASYLEATPEARYAVDGIVRLAQAHRTAVEAVQDRVDFARLEERIMAAVAEAPATETARPNHQPGIGATIAAFWQSWRGVMISATATAAVMLLLLPIGGEQTSESGQPQVIHHHTYVIGNMPGTRIEQVDYQPGFTGTSHMPTNGEGVPVIWFTEDEPEEDDLPL